MSVEMADVSGLRLQAERSSSADEDRMREKAREAQEQVSIRVNSSLLDLNVIMAGGSGSSQLAPCHSASACGRNQRYGHASSA